MIIEGLAAAASEVAATGASEAVAGEVAAKGAEVGTSAADVGKAFSPDKRLDAGSEIKSATQEKAFDPDKRIQAYESDKTDVSSEDVKDDGLFTRLEDRINQAKSSDGEWSDEPGKSEFTPNSQEAKEALEKEGETSVKYDDNGEPDFHPVSKGTVEIDNMTEHRLPYTDKDGVRQPGNFEQADTKLAEQWNNDAKDGKTDWTARDVADWVKDNNLTRHECLDKKTVEYVDSSLHDACKHYGGCAECKARDNLNNGGKFDA